MKKANLTVALLLIAIAIVVIIDAVRLGFRWSPSGPQSGFFPFWLGTILLVCSALELRKLLAEYRKRGPSKPLMGEGALKSIAWVLLPALGMVMVTELVGLHIAAALYLAFYMRAVGKIQWSTTVAVSILVPVALYIAFDKFFLVPMPEGLWGAKLLRF
jgi:putative tricarboxylic transport membrane protein